MLKYRISPICTNTQLYYIYTANLIQVTSTLQTNMIHIQTENTPFFELVVTKFAIKSITVQLYKEPSTAATPPQIRYEITAHSTGKSASGVENDEESAFAKAISMAGYDRKKRALPEIKKHHHVKDYFHKIGNLEFSKVIRKAMH